jgi:hypothetical protein
MRGRGHAPSQLLLAPSEVDRRGSARPRAPRSVRARFRWQRLQHPFRHRALPCGIVPRGALERR